MLNIAERNGGRDELGDALRVRVVDESRVRQSIGKIRHRFESVNLARFRGRPTGGQRGRGHVVEAFVEDDYRRREFFIRLCPNRRRAQPDSRRNNCQQTDQTQNKQSRIKTGHGRFLLIH